MSFYLRQFCFLLSLWILTLQPNILLPIDLNEEHLSQILEHKQLVASIKQRWKPKVEILKQLDPDAYSDLERVLKTGHFIKMPMVNSGVYILKDAYDQPQYIIKPLDERIFCVNNLTTVEKNYSLTTLMRTYIPNYEVVQREALAYLVSTLIGVEYLVPKSFIAVIKKEEFFDIFDVLTPSDHTKWVAFIDKEKLCSVQAFISDAQMLYDRQNEWTSKKYSTNKILREIDPVSFENLMILIWTIHDTDVHAGNILLQISSQKRDPVFKIDHDLSFPEHNGSLMNCLILLPQADFPFSSRAQEKIKQIPVDVIVSWMHFFELEEAIDAFLDRIEVLQKLTAENLTILEIDLRLRLLGLPNGKELALKNWTLGELLGFLEDGMGYSTSTNDSS